MMMNSMETGEMYASKMSHVTGLPEELIGHQNIRLRRARRDAL